MVQATLFILKINSSSTAWPSTRESRNMTDPSKEMVEELTGISAEKYSCVRHIIREIKFPERVRYYGYNFLEIANNFDQIFYDCTLLYLKSLCGFWTTVDTMPLYIWKSFTVTDRDEMQRIVLAALSTKETKFAWASLKSCIIFSVMTQTDWLCTLIMEWYFFTDYPFSTCVISKFQPIL